MTTGDDGQIPAPLDASRARIDEEQCRDRAVAGCVALHLLDAGRRRPDTSASGIDANAEHRADAARAIGPELARGSVAGDSHERAAPDARENEAVRSPIVVQAFGPERAVAHLAKHDASRDRRAVAVVRRANGAEARRGAQRDDRRVALEVAPEPERRVVSQRRERAGGVAGTGRENGASPLIRGLGRPRRRRTKRLGARRGDVSGSPRRGHAPPRRTGDARGIDAPDDSPAPARRAASARARATSPAGGAVGSCGDARTSGGRRLGGLVVWWFGGEVERPREAEASRGRFHFTTSPLHHFTTSPLHHFTVSPFHHLAAPRQIEPDVERRRVAGGGRRHGEHQLSAGPAEDAVARVRGVAPTLARCTAPARTRDRSAPRRRRAAT